MCSSPAAQSNYEIFKTYRKFCALTGKQPVGTIMVVFVLYCCILQINLTLKQDVLILSGVKFI